MIYPSIHPSINPSIKLKVIVYEVSINYFQTNLKVYCIHPAYSKTPVCNRMNSIYIY